MAAENKDKELNASAPALTAAPDSAPTAAAETTKASPKASPEEKFSDSAKKDDDEDARQEKSDHWQELIEILKEIAEENALGNQAEKLGGEIKELGSQLWDKFNSPGQIPGEESTAKQDNPIKMDMATDTQGTNLASLNEKGSSPELESMSTTASAAPTPAPGPPKPDSTPDLDSFAGAVPKI